MAGEIIPVLCYLSYFMVGRLSLESWAFWAGKLKI